MGRSFRLARLAGAVALTTLGLWTWTATPGLTGALATAAEAPIPEHTGLVVDAARVLPPELAQGLEASLREFQARYGPQIQLLTIPSLEGQSIEEYSIAVADRWKVGSAARDDGAILVVAAGERKLRIEVGKGLEGQLPDILAGRIIRDVIVPEFRAGDLPRGIVAGLQEIARRAGGELPVVRMAGAPGRGGRTRQEGWGLGLFPLLILLFVILPMFSRRSGGAGGILTGFLIGNLLGGGGRGGGRDDDSFGGGGGGGFNGGGSSGSW